MNPRLHRSHRPFGGLLLVALLVPTLTGLGAGTNLLVTPAPLPDATGSIARIFASLAFVLALFFGGVWLFRNWQRLSQSHRRTRLNILEARPLGPRQALYVIGYNHQRFLVGASQAGISLISPLPSGDLPDPGPGSTPGPSPLASPLTHAPSVTPFAETLQQLLGRK